MAITNEIKCARCDRKYSGVRSRCPYCGARRIGRGKYTEDSDNAKGKMLIGVLILAVFAVGAIVLLMSTPNQDDGGQQEPEIVDPTPPDNYIPHEPPPPPIITPEPTIAPLEVTSVMVTYGGAPLRYGNEFTQSLGVPIELGVRVEPVGINVDVVWENNSEDIFTFTQVVGGIRLEGIEKGRGQLVVRAGEKEHVVTVVIN